MANQEIAILSCILGGFDTPVDPVKQSIPIKFHRWTDENFPPIRGLTPRLQYRIPKMFGWQMLPGHSVYIWLDGAFSFTRKDSAKWFVDQLGHGDIALFRHPWRKTIKEEVEHIDDYLNRRKGTKRGQDYLIARYKNGLHKEQYNDILLDRDYVDDILYASTAFIYKDNDKTREFFKEWFLLQARYFTCDQVVLPWLVWKHDLDVNVIEENQYKLKHLTEVSKHA